MDKSQTGVGNTRGRRRFTHLRIVKGKSLREKALRWLAGFLLLMLLFTLLSRAADELTIPRVSLEAPQKRSIDHKVTAFGKAEELSAKAVTSIPGVRVAAVSVKAGEKVEKDTPLFTLDQEDLTQKWEEAKQELEKMNMDLSDLSEREALEAQDRETALARAKEDYSSVKAAADKEVDRAAKALEKAKSQLEESGQPPEQQELSRLRAVCAEKEEVWQAAEKACLLLQEEWEEEANQARKAAEEMGEDPDAAEAVLRAQYDQKLNAAEENREAARREKEEAQAALSQAEQQGIDRKALQEVVETAQLEYDRVIESRENSLRASLRAVEDAQRPAVPDSSGEKVAMERDAQEEKVGQLRGLLEMGGVVRAPQAGVVTGVFLEVGSPIPEGTAVLLSDSASGVIFTAQAPANQEKYLLPGDEVLLKLGEGKKDLTGLTLESVEKDKADQSLLNITVRLPNGAMEIGAAAEMEALRKSEEYPLCVPLSALHEENGVYYLLVTKETETVLGKELVAARLDVTVLEKNEAYAALAESSLLQGQKFLVYSNKPVKAGDRIRPEKP